MQIDGHQIDRDQIYKQNKTIHRQIDRQNDRQMDRKIDGQINGQLRIYAKLKRIYKKTIDRHIEIPRGIWSDRDRQKTS